VFFSTFCSDLILNLAISNIVLRNNIPTSLNCINNNTNDNKFYNIKYSNKYPYFLLCKICFWCCTNFLNKSEAVTKCPSCNGSSSNIGSIPLLSTKRACKNNSFDHYNHKSHKQEQVGRLLYFPQSINVSKVKMSPMHKKKV
jgi:hypothetical protein